MRASGCKLHHAKPLLTIGKALFMTRREFLLAGAATPAILEAITPAKQLGLDLFSLRSQGWTAFQLLDFAHAHGAVVANFSEPRFLGGTDSEHLKRVREHAETLGLRIEVGFGSICPTSTRFIKEDGSAREQLLKMFGIARILGSPFVRCYLGSAEERKGEIPLEQHIDNTIAACRSVRDEDGRHGIKIAVENHAGDLQAQQLRDLVEEAGTDYVGTLLDTGNATWTLEDPFHTLEVLAPLALTTGIRDSRIWIEDDAVSVMWVPMGQGNIGMERWAQRFFELRPDLAFSLEIINLRSARKFAVRDNGFWKHYRDVPAWVFEGFMKLARDGEPYVPAKGDPVALERREIEADLAYSRKLLGLA